MAHARLSALLLAIALAACAAAGPPEQLGQRLIIRWQEPRPALDARLGEAARVLGTGVEHVREMSGGADLVRLRRALTPAELEVALARLNAAAGIRYAVVEHRRGVP